MATAGDFIRIQKTDFHNHLDFGMRPSSYISWAGFYIPEMTAKEIETYSRIRIQTEKDVQSLLSLSLNEAQADNVTVLEGSVDVELNRFCHSSAAFVDVVKKTVEKYSSKLQFIPYLSVNTDVADNSSLVSSFMSGNVFSGVELYGKTVFENPDYFVQSSQELHSLGYKLKLNLGHFKNEEQLACVLEKLSPDMIICMEKNVFSDNIIKLLKESQLRVCLSPLCSDSESLLRLMLDQGLNVKISSSRILLTNMTLSDFASQLMNSQKFIKEEVTSLFS